MIDVNRKKIILIVSFLLLLIFSSTGVFYYFQYREHENQQYREHENQQYREHENQQLFLQQHQQIINSFNSMTVENVDFKKIADELGALLKDPRINNLDLQKIAQLKIAYADSLSENEPLERLLVLKEVAVDSRYPNHLRSKAINFIVDDYELAPDYEFAQKYIFIGEPFKNFLQGDDIELAIRRLNEWSDEVSPNVIANYRIAKWYASQIYQNQQLSLQNKNQLLSEMHKRLKKADELFIRHKNTTPNGRIGLAYELKARTIYMAGEPGYKEKTEEFFDKSINALEAPPNSIFQLVYLNRAALYYLAFLAREYDDTQAERIRRHLKFFSDYLETPQEPRLRNTRLVKFLIAARDSTDPKYPFPDFNREDIKNLSKIDERFGKIIENLNYLEYIKGHPIEKARI